MSRSRQEKEIFKDPENEVWGEDLWTFSRNWGVYSRLFILRTRMVEYLEPEAKRFLQLYWQQRSGSNAKEYVEQMGNLELFGRQPAAFEANRKELKEGLINPTMNMLDMVTLTFLRPLRRVRIVRSLIRTVSTDLQTRRHSGRSPLADAQ